MERLIRSRPDIFTFTKIASAVQLPDCWCKNTTQKIQLWNNKVDVYFKTEADSERNKKTKHDEIIYVTDKATQIKLLTRTTQALMRGLPVRATITDAQMVIFMFGRTNKKLGISAKSVLFCKLSVNY